MSAIYCYCFKKKKLSLLTMYGFELLFVGGFGLFVKWIPVVQS